MQKIGGVVFNWLVILPHIARTKLKIEQGVFMVHGIYVSQTPFNGI